MPPLLSHTVIGAERRIGRMSTSTLGLLMTGAFSLLVIWQVYTHDNFHRELSTRSMLLTPQQMHSPPQQQLHSPPPRDVCHIDLNSEYPGEVVLSGANNIKATAGECCALCSSTSSCNVWVWCADKAGCGAQLFGECWLKRANVDVIFDAHVGHGHPGIPWTSGAIISEADEAVQFGKMQAKNKEEADRLAALRNDQELPMIFLEVAINGSYAGRMEAVLFSKESPLAAENLRRLCTGEVVHKITGKPYALKGASFYRIIDRFIDQTGVHSDSTFGGPFKDDPGGLKFTHDRPYLLSLANAGPNTNTGHFSITLAPAHHLDGKYVIFGELLSGFDVAEKINLLSRGYPNNELYCNWVNITNTGQLRRGLVAPLPDHRPQA